ncbi:hypothetical protein PASE110613_05585 [Paenibacillus sediminis]|uniref:Glycosyltransferase n=1 Tax=Paenibacillus sediminis TaxID=664909 RepID=A0ABS4H145_9BACL|nr:hypothetical protein [Paenibacillus sediminis]MBP1936249.1 hypothetical protein [Paenibacillus sediminis]
MIICSVAGGNHLSMAKALAKSVKVHSNHCKFVLCLVEEEIHPDALNFPYFDHVVRAKDLNVPNFYKFVSKYNLYEAACALKPYLLLYAIEVFRSEKNYLYLDSDLYVYSPLDRLEEQLSKHSILLTPHRLEPQDILNSIDEEIVNLKDGVYQAGFLGLRKTEESIMFLKWWAERSYDFCYADPDEGLFLDQKWLDLVPCFFDGVHILQDPGYNMASWNLSQRKLTRNETNQYMVNGKPLVFFHFSGLGKWLDNSMRLHAPNKSDYIYTLVEDFITEYIRMGYYKYINIPWSYKNFDYEEYLMKQFMRGVPS